jgi:hypothetical protein
MSSIPSSVENKLHKLLEFLVPSGILLRNRVEPPIPNVKVEQVEDKLQKPTLDVKLKQIEQGNGYVKIRLATKNQVRF